MPHRKKLKILKVGQGDLDDLFPVHVFLDSLEDCHRLVEILTNYGVLAEKSSLSLNQGKIHYYVALPLSKTALQAALGIAVQHCGYDEKCTAKTAERFELTLPSKADLTSLKMRRRPAFHGLLVN